MIKLTSGKTSGKELSAHVQQLTVSPLQKHLCLSLLKTSGQFEETT